LNSVMESGRVKKKKREKVVEEDPNQCEIYE
jgi:hypothetical protein